jgi:hypothetical protein
MGYFKPILRPLPRHLRPREQPAHRRCGHCARRTDVPYAIESEIDTILCIDVPDFSQTPAELPENVVTVAEVKSAQHEAEQRAPDAPTICIRYMGEDADAARRLCHAITSLGRDC